MSAIAEWARSGVVSLTGSPHGPPLIPPGNAAGHLVRIGSTICADVDPAALLAERAAVVGLRRGGSVSAGGAARLLRATDGIVAVSCARADDHLLLGALIGESVSPDEVWSSVPTWVGAHTCDEFDDRAELLGVAGSSVGLAVTPGHDVVVAAAGSLPRRSVRDLVVVDFSALWAGPLCAQLLGAAGARIIKVEIPTRLDGARRSPEFYDLLHGGHKSVVLDPSVTVERDALIALAHAADIVIEASRPRALRAFGIDADEVVRDGATWVAITAAGRSRNRVGFGDDVAAGAGLIAHDASGTPCFVGDAIADPITGITAAALAMSEPPGGSGVLWDVAMTDVVAAMTPERGRSDMPGCVQDSGGRWWVDDGTRAHSVAPPRARSITASAPRPGADTASVLRSLGIGWF